MKNLAPSIYRQRMIIEGIYRAEITSATLINYMRHLSSLLGMTIIYGPHVMRQAELRHPKYKGFEAVMVWAESGVTLYTWENESFFTVDLYSCKKYDPKQVLKFTAEYLEVSKIVFKNV